MMRHVRRNIGWLHHHCALLWRRLLETCLGPAWEQTPGSAITYSSLGNLASSEDVLLRLAADLGESLTGIGDWSDQADPDSLDLSNQLSAIVGSRTVGGFPDEDAFERLRSEVGCRGDRRPGV